MRGFIEEPRHRNVFRIAIAYVAAGWLIAQVADLVASAFNWPESFLQMVIVLLVLGFPVALLLAWAFELTPEGLKRTSDLPVESSTAARSGKALDRATIVALVIAVAWLAWDKFHNCKKS